MTDVIKWSHILTLVLGASLGFVSSIITIRINHRFQIANELIKKFFQVRDDLCEKVCSLTNLNLNDVCQLKNLDQHIDEVSKLYYKNYDFLPTEILFELNCLYACLKDENGNIYRSENGDLRIIHEQELEGFLEKISIIENFKLIAYYNLKSDDNNLKRASCINYQARFLLRTLNQNFTTKQLYEIVKKLKK